MMKTLRYLRAAINTFPEAFRSGVYYFGKSWDTAIKLALLDGVEGKPMEWRTRPRMADDDE